MPSTSEMNVAPGIEAGRRAGARAAVYWKIAVLAAGRVAAGDRPVARAHVGRDDREVKVGEPRAGSQQAGHEGRKVARAGCLLQPRGDDESSITNRMSTARVGVNAPGRRPRPPVGSRCRPRRWGRRRRAARACCTPAASAAAEWQRGGRLDRIMAGRECGRRADRRSRCVAVVADARRLADALPKRADELVDAHGRDRRYEASGAVHECAMYRPRPGVASTGFSIQRCTARSARRSP